MEYAKDLRKCGAIVVPVQSFLDPEMFDSIQAEMIETLSSFPEFKEGLKLTDHTKLVLGGFGALGNPGSFHNPFVRRMRQWCMTTLMPVFQEYVKLLPNGPNFKLEQLIDRMMYRPLNAAATPESWHRDVARGTQPSDVTFGGWVNLSKETQKFSCVLQTHAAVPTGKGFAVLTSHQQGLYTMAKQLNLVKTEKQRETLLKKIKANLAKAEATVPQNKDALEYAQGESEAVTKHTSIMSRYVEVPPGHILLFNETLVHEVMSSKSNQYPSMRLFLGWRLTESEAPLKLHLTNAPTYDIMQRLTDQDVCSLKSGQQPAIHPSTSLNYDGQRYELIKWSNEMLKPAVLVCREVCLEKQIKTKVDSAKPFDAPGNTLMVNRPIPTAWHAADTMPVVSTMRKCADHEERHRVLVAPKAMSSLKSYGLPLYQAYTTEERQMHTPNTSWSLLVPGGKRKRSACSLF